MQIVLHFISNCNIFKGLVFPFLGAKVTDSCQFPQSALVGLR